MANDTPHDGRPGMADQRRTRWPREQWAHVVLIVRLGRRRVHGFSMTLSNPQGSSPRLRMRKKPREESGRPHQGSRSPPTCCYEQQSCGISANAMSAWPTSIPHILRIPSLQGRCRATTAVPRWDAQRRRPPRPWYQGATDGTGNRAISTRSPQRQHGRRKRGRGANYEGDQGEGQLTVQEGVVAYQDV